VPDGLQQIVGWMMAKEPAGRYPTPERAAGALETFLVAGGVPPSSPDLDPEMKPYLTWLEAENSKPPPVPPAPAAPLRVPAKPPPARPDRPRGSKRKDRKGRARPPEVAAFDVELVAVAPGPDAGAPGLWLSRRDFLMFVTGVGSVLLAILAGWALAALFGRR